MRYTVLLDPWAEGGGYTVTVPALPGCITQGQTVEEALARAREAIEGFVANMAADGEPIPIEEPPLVALAVEVEVAVPAGVGA